MRLPGNEEEANDQEDGEYEVSDGAARLVDTHDPETTLTDPPVAGSAMSKLAKKWQCDLEKDPI